MASVKPSTQLNVKKLYQFIFKGQEYMLEEEEARQIKKLFVNMLPEKDDSPNVNSHFVLRGMIGDIRDKRRIIPEGYVKIGSSETAPKMGNKPTVFDYYRNEENSYAFSVPSQTRLAFCRLGKISDPKSIIGRCVRMIPQYESFNRGDLKRLGIISSSEYRKSLCDILEIEGYIHKVSTVFADNHHARHSYKQTNKIDGLGVDNNHGFPKEEGFPLTHK